jgi:hypothetical protein
MTGTRTLVASVAVSALLLPAARVSRAQDTPVHDVQPDRPPGWPRSFDDGGTKITVYQPQLERWDHVTLDARAAVAIEPQGASQPVYGVVWFSSRTEIDKEQRLVTLENVDLPRASFPSAPDNADAWLALLKTHFGGVTKTVSLDRLEASLAALRAESVAAGAAAIRNDPPQIVFSTEPSLLVLVDGAPVLRRTTAPGLERVVNSRALLLQDDASGKFFLAVGGGWLSSRALDGAWALASPPDGANALLTSAKNDQNLDLLDQDQQVNERIAAGGAVRVLVRTGPTELVETTGEPDLQPIQGTQLLWIKNTTADVVIDSTTNQWYVLASGRWFRGPGRDGPWGYVAGTDLPGDFSKIPATDPAAEVRSSIPGTPEAAEAEIQNEIPQTATIERSQASFTASYDGDADFEPIEGTDLRYAVNCASPVVLCGGQYFACESGVWFVSASSLGPWYLANEVAAAIYSIPPSCSIHYVTYCRVYRHTDAYVSCGYTPGYLGTCVNRDGCVVWGTGYTHRAWIGKVWIGRPWSYGFGVAVHSCGDGWGVAIGAAARPAIRPWWGALRVEHPAFAPARWAGAHADFHANNANVYSTRWHAAVVAPVRVVERREVHPTPARPNNVFAAPDGRIYRRSAEGAWEHHDQQGAWQRTTAAQSENVQRLEAEHHVREQGQVRVQVREAPRPAPVRSVPRGIQGSRPVYRGRPQR